MPRRGRGAKPFRHFVQTSTAAYSAESSEESENADGAFLCPDSDSDSEGAVEAAAGELNPSRSVARTKESSTSSSTHSKKHRSSTRRCSKGAAAAAAAASRPLGGRHKFVSVSARRPVVVGVRRGYTGRRARIVRHRRGCCGATPTTINVRIKNTDTLRYLQVRFSCARSVGPTCLAVCPSVCLSLCIRALGSAFQHLPMQFVLNRTGTACCWTCRIIG